MQERYIKWWTPYLSREFEMLVFGNGGGLPLIIFPTSFGNYRQNKDFGLIDSVAWFVDNNRVTVYCPDSIDLDSFYNKGIHPADRMRTHIAYENVIVRDVFDFARREGNTHRVGVCGASLGAYHAANIAFRHADTVSHLISLSGAFEIIRSTFAPGSDSGGRKSAKGREDGGLVVSGRLLLVPPAIQDGFVAATNAVRGATMTLGEAVNPIGSFTDPEYAQVGLTEAKAREKHEVVVAVVHFDSTTRTIIDGRKVGFCKLIVDRTTYRMLGCHVVGERAVEITQVAAIAIAAKMRVDELAHIPLSFPTYAGILARVAASAARELNLKVDWQAHQAESTWHQL